MTEDPTLKQGLQIPQRFAGDRGHGHPTHPTASGWIEHPLRYFQTPSLLVLLDAAPEYRLPIFDERFTNLGRTAIPRTPWVTDFSRFSTMGVSLSSRTTTDDHTKVWDPAFLPHLQGYR
jgi:hypothetical protein